MQGQKELQQKKLTQKKNERKKIITGMSIMTTNDHR